MNNKSKFASRDTLFMPNCTEYILSPRIRNINNIPLPSFCCSSIRSIDKTTLWDVLEGPAGSGRPKADFPCVIGESSLVPFVLKSPVDLPNLTLSILEPIAPEIMFCWFFVVNPFPVLFESVSQSFASRKHQYLVPESALDWTCNLIISDFFELAKCNV